MYEPDAGLTGFYSAVNHEDVALREYEDINSPGPSCISQPSNLRSTNNSQVSNPHDTMHGCDIPLRVCVHFHRDKYFQTYYGLHRICHDQFPCQWLCLTME